MQKLKNKIFAGIGVFIVISAIISAGIFSNLLETWNLKLRNSLYQKTADKSQNIVIVAIDSKSLDENSGLGRFQNWRRTFYAKVLNEIEKGSPRLVVFDVLFNTRTRGIPEESLKEKFAEIKELTAENAPNFVEFLTSYIDKNTHPDDKIFADEIAKYKNVLLAQNAAISTKTPQNILEADMLSEPIKILKDSTPNIGMINIMPDKDNIVRRIPLGTKYQDKFYKMLPILAAEQISKTEIPTSNGMIINFKENPSRFEKIPFIDVYNGKINPEIFKDKIILIGATAQALQDFQFTPISVSTPMPGVEIQAHAIETILNKDFLMPQSKTSALIISLIISALVIFISLKFNFIIAIFCAILIPIFYFISAKFAFNKGAILDMIYPFLAIAASYVISLIYRYFAEYREKRIVRNAFSHYVNKSVVDEIMKNPDLLKLGGSRREITVFFTDIAHFTTYSELLPPETITSILNKYFDAMSRVIFEHGGTLDKFEGDAIMAFFNAPLDQENHAELACKTILGMRRALEDFNNSLNIGNMKMINFRAGICTGPAVVGNLGSAARFDYTAIGDTVNIASRLESANKQFKTNTMVSEPTYEAVKDKFIFREIDLIKVVGKSLTMKVYELMAEKENFSDIGGRLKEAYLKALSLYQERKFAEAKTAFEEALKIYQEDGPSKTYILRCEEFIKNPPKQDWDGVWELKTK